MHGKTRKFEGMRRTCLYAAMTENAAQRSRWTFCEVVTKGVKNHENNCLYEAGA